LGIQKDIGIDLGTAYVLVYQKGKGVVINEPSVVAIDIYTDQILAIGAEAKKMIGRTPGNIVALRPLREGVISNYNVTERMLKHFIGKVCGRGFSKPRILVGIPSGVTEVEKRAISEAAIQAGGKEVFLIEEPLAAAIGAGIDISKPNGVMIIDIGGGTTDIAVISLGSIVTSKMLKVAGESFDDAIVKYMRKEYNLYIGEQTAEDLKINIGGAYPREEPVYMQCSGRDLLAGLPRTVEVSSAEMLEALDESIQILCGAIREVLEQTPPELAADIGTNGIVLSGGGALLYGIDKRIEECVGIRTIVAEDPLSCVAVGTGIALDLPLPSRSRRT